MDCEDPAKVWDESLKKLNLTIKACTDMKVVLKGMMVKNKVLPGTES